MSFHKKETEQKIELVSRPGIYSEIKYDGERVQLHKKGEQIAYYSRSLKPVMPHKIKHFKDHLGKAFPQADELILDAEVLMIDNKTGVPLPFGTLGVHKAAGYADAQVWSLTQAYILDRFLIYKDSISAEKLSFPLEF